MRSAPAATCTSVTQMPRIHRQSGASGLIVAIVASFAALGLAMITRELISPHYFFILLTGVIFSAWFGGRAPGLLATAISVVLAAIFFVPPEGGLGIPPAAEAFQLGAFVLAGMITSVLYESERRARRTAQMLAAEQDAILQQMADGVILVDTEGRVLFINHNARAIHPNLNAGMSIEVLRDGDGLRHASGGRLPLEQFPLMRALREGITIRSAMWRVAAGATSTRIVDGSAAPVTVAGEPYGAVLLLRDVTEARSLAEERDRLLGEREAVASRAAFFAEASAMLASSLDLETTLASIARLSVAELADWCLVDLREPDGSIRRITVTHADPSLADVAATLQQRSPSSLNPDDLPLRVMRDGEPVLLTTIDDDELRRCAQDDEHLDALRRTQLRSLLCVPLASRGRILGAVQLGRSGNPRRFGAEDVTMVMELANRAAIAVENAQLYAAALAGSKAKSDFLAVMSHELRTPLNAIIGYADLLRSGIPDPLPASLRPYVERTLTASRHLLQLINEVLTFSRIEAGRANIQLENAELSILLREVRMLLEPLAAEKQLRFTAEWPSEPVVLRTDPRKVRQILVNLTANAIKFTERGSVAVTSWRDGDSVYMAVTDTGIGIEPDHLEHIFEPFWQVEQRPTRRTGGTGLGLSIVRRLAQLLGGDVHIQSVPGEGSTFTVRLPVQLERRRRDEADAREEGESATTATGDAHGAQA